MQEESAERSKQLLSKLRFFPTTTVCQVAFLYSGRPAAGMVHHLIMNLREQACLIPAEYKLRIMQLALPQKTDNVELIRAVDLDAFGE